MGYKFSSKLKIIVFLLFVFTTTSCFATNDEHTGILSIEQLQSRGQIYHDNFVVNAIPKCGTHLIMRCIYLMINKRVEETSDYVQEKDFTPKKAQKYLYFLRSKKGLPGIHKTHVPYFPQMAYTILKAGMKSIFFIRDPRDALVSLVFYMDIKSGNHRDFMHIDSAVYDTLSFDEKIKALMTGSCCTNYIETFLKPFIKWTTYKYNLSAKFEDLIGPSGGGTREKQLQVIEQIASYLNITLSTEEKLAIAEHTNTYKTPKIQESMGKSYVQGQIGNWKSFLNAENKQLFKDLFGKQLIKLGYEKDNNW